MDLNFEVFLAILELADYNTLWTCRLLDKIFYVLATKLYWKDILAQDFRPMFRALKTYYQEPILHAVRALCPDS